MENEVQFINPPTNGVVLDTHEEDNAALSEKDKNISYVAGLAVFIIFLSIVFTFLAAIDSSTTSKAGYADNQLRSFERHESGQVAGSSTNKENEVTPLVTPSLSPTPEFTKTSTPTPSPSPTPEPTFEPTATPSPEPTMTPSYEPTPTTESNSETYHEE